MKLDGPEFAKEKPAMRLGDAMKEVEMSLENNMEAIV